MTELKDYGLMDYALAWKEQQTCFDALLSGERSEGVLMLCEHPHVYTLGRSGQENNLLVDSAFLQRIGATYYRTDRGGDVTYHGPGQLVGYPVLDLRQAGGGIGLREYIHRLEQTVIDTVAEWDLKTERLEGATGVWLRDEQGERKICAVGVRASRFVTMHGFALNVSTDLSYFNHINPCGFADKGATSLAQELGSKAPQMGEVKRRFITHFERLLG